MSPRDKSDKSVSYLDLLSSHTEFRCFLLSYIVTMLGEWLTYVASMAMIENGNENIGKLAISGLVVVRLLPTVIWAPLGGVLADSYDRKRNMILLDILAACISVLFYLANRMQSLALLYVATFLQQSIAGLYEPSRSAIVPMLVQSPRYLPKATTAVGMVWSTMTAAGASISGFVVAYLGISECFIIDGITFLASAIILSRLEKSYQVPQNQNASQHDGASGVPEGKRTSNLRMILESLQYLLHSPFGAIVMIKGCGSLLFGASDVIAVAFAQDDSGELNSLRLGIFFAFVGIGCVTGPNLFDALWQAHRNGENQAWLWGAGLAYGLVGLGFIFTGLAKKFLFKCTWNAIRASGVAVLWINSSQLLQVLTPPFILGRVMAIDLALATLGETMSAIAAGLILDKTTFTADHIAISLGTAAMIFCVIWIVYSCYATPRLGNPTTEKSAEMSALTL